MSRCRRFRGGSLAAALMLACGVAGVHAQALGLKGGNMHPKSQQARVTPQNSNADQGRFIAFGGEHAALHVSCASCHQLDGTGDPSGAFPRLAQQDASYLYGALRSFASGARQSDIMTPIARELTDQAMRDVAAFYSSVGAQPYAPSGWVDPRTIAQGRGLAEHGADGKKTACDQCHGPEGRGVRDNAPYLAGQFASYLEAQLESFKQGKRHGPGATDMHRIASGLDEAQIRDVAAYFSSLEPRDSRTAAADLLHRVGVHARPSIDIARGATEIHQMGAGQPR